MQDKFVPDEIFQKCRHLKGMGESFEELLYVDGVNEFDQEQLIENNEDSVFDQDMDSGDLPFYQMRDIYRTMSTSKNYSGPPSGNSNQKQSQGGIDLPNRNPIGSKEFWTGIATVLATLIGLFAAIFYPTLQIAQESARTQVDAAQKIVEAAKADAANSQARLESIAERIEHSNELLRKDVELRLYQFEKDNRPLSK